MVRVKDIWKRTWIARIWANYKARGLQDIFNPKKMQAFTEGEIVKARGIHLEYDEIQSYAEQVVFRMYMCECAGLDHCPHCTCQQPVSFFCRTSQCSQGNYDGMQKPKEWNSFKEEHEIKFIVNSKHGK